MARTALVPVKAADHEASRGRPGRAYERPYAPFVAHLIATATGAPQTRERRRIAPQIAASRYVAASRL